jgi:hypothetical protein
MDVLRDKSLYDGFSSEIHHTILIKDSLNHLAKVDGIDGRLLSS